MMQLPPMVVRSAAHRICAIFVEVVDAANKQVVAITAVLALFRVLATCAAL